jgi:hypothetical protein
VTLPHWPGANVGSRYLPTYCPHGRTIDQGDFGHQTDAECQAYDKGPHGWCSYCYPTCPDCETDRAIEWADAIERMIEHGTDFGLAEQDDAEAALLKVLGHAAQPQER